MVDMVHVTADSVTAMLDTGVSIVNLARYVKKSLLYIYLCV